MKKGKFAIGRRFFFYFFQLEPRGGRRAPEASALPGGGRMERGEEEKRGERWTPGPLFLSRRVFPMQRGGEGKESGNLLEEEKKGDK